MRSLVVSDLHLGTRTRRYVLHRREPLDGLLAALEGIDRLVLLGDIVELLEGHVDHAMEVSERVLREIGTRLGPDREVVFVPGNHDAALLRPWVYDHLTTASVDVVVPPDATPMLREVTSWLAPARVEVHYPGVWLAEGVWATHGHYVNRHLFPPEPWGIARGLLRRLPAEGVLPLDYEEPDLRPWLTQVGAGVRARLPRPLAVLANDVLELVRGSTMPGPEPPRVRRPLPPFLTRVLGAQVRHASIPAIARVAHRLHVDADHVIFGHVHRRGPLPADDPATWLGLDGRLRVMNTGSWLYEPLLIHHAVPPHPYWPGGGVIVEDGAAPRSVGLLDHLALRQMH